MENLENDKLTNETSIKEIESKELTLPESISKNDSEELKLMIDEKNDSQETDSDKKFLNKTKRKYNKIKCYNIHCNQKNLNKLYNIKINDECNLYCEVCAKFIKKRWVCIFCNFIFTESDNYLCMDFREWIGCDNNKCARWMHLECEEQFGIKNIRELITDTYKYYCPDCRNEKIKVNKEETKKREIEKRKNPFFDKNDIKKIMINKRRNIIKTYNNINYLYSENYISIDKLFSTYGFSINLTDSELKHDFDIINSQLGYEHFKLNNINKKEILNNKGIKKQNKLKNDDISVDEFV